MYYVLTCKDKVRLPAQLFALKLEDALTQILRDKYERRVDKDAGVILSLWNVKPEGDGLVIAGDNAAYYEVAFDVLAYHPLVNEVIETDVSEIVEFGAFLSLGPMEGLVHLSQIANDFLTYNKKTQAFTGRESKKVFRKGDHIFAKISTVSMKNNIPETKIGLTMRPEGLGKDEWLSKSNSEPAEKTAAAGGAHSPKANKEESKKKKKEEKAS